MAATPKVRTKSRVGVRVRKAALLFHAFFATSGAEPADPHPLWRAAMTLGLRDQVNPYPDELPVTTLGYSDRLEVLAAAQRRGPGVHQALAFHQHDVLGVTVVIAPAAIDGWIGLDRTWRQVIDGVPMPGLIGTVTEYLGLLSNPGPLRFTMRNRAAHAPASIGNRLRPQVPTSTGDWPNWWCRGGPGALVWELPATDPAIGTRRRLLVLGREADEDAIDRWLWSDETPGLVPFTRYLMHAAKLRHQSVLLAGSLPRLRRAGDAAEAACNQLRDYLDGEETTSVDRLIAADRVVSRVQTERTGLIAALADVRSMARTVEAAQLNMAAAAGSGAMDVSGGPFASDRQIAQWAVEQLRSEEIYLAAAQQRAKELARVTGAVVARDLSDRQERLRLLQTSIIGSLLMALTGVQALQYVVPLPGPLLAPLLVTLAALALVLPIAVPSWSRGSVPRGWWPFNVALLALLGAAGGWLTASVISLSVSGRVAGPGWTLPVALLGAVLTVGSGLLRLRPSKAPG